MKPKMEIRILPVEEQGPFVAYDPNGQTRRPIAEGAERLLRTPFAALDHGFVRLIDYMGDEAAIVQAARVSYGRGTKSTLEDRGLIRYLMRHYHSTPFEMVEAKFHVKLPIFVARQWIRHRTANVNEYSARYSIMDKEFYIPQPEHMAAQSSSNSQGRGDVLTPAQAITVQRLLREDAERAYSHYEAMLAEKERPDENEAELDVNSLTSQLVWDDDFPGLARELARMNLSLNFYTQWYWKIDLHNLLGFLRLRADAHAQYEIRIYAEIMLEMVRQWLPNVYDAFIDYRHEAANFSKPMLEALGCVLRGENIPKDNCGMSKRELTDFLDLVGGKLRGTVHFAV